jgi:hypothetical protein
MTLSFAVHAASTVDCDLDNVMKTQRQKMDELSLKVYDEYMGKTIKNAPTAKDASCLPALDALDALIRLRIPSVGGAMGAIFTKVRDMACTAANNYIQSVANQAQFNVSDPIGIVGVGVGGTTDGTGGLQTDQYDFGKVVENAASSAAGSVISGAKGNATQIIKGIPSSPANRTPRVENTIRNEVNDAIKGL